MPTHIVACNWLRVGKFIQFLNGVWSLLLAVSADVNLHEENRLQAALNGVPNSRCDGSIIAFCEGGELCADVVAEEDEEACLSLILIGHVV